MTFWGAIYKLVFGPLELLFEFLFMFSYNIIGNTGLSIILLSLAMNFLLMPLYKRTDAIQKEAADTEKRLQPRVKRIKKAFKGDERFMMLQTYYRQNNYKPTDVLKGSISLLLEIPFFIAAYNFLSNLQRIQGMSFGPIANLGVPDGMLVIGGLTINVLPILMTVINIISGAIYTRGQPMRNKIQLYGMAAIFLVLLYDSPSALVLYWTLNNLFSLVKNIIDRLKFRKLFLAVSSAVISVALVAALWIIHPFSALKQIFFTAVCLLLTIPLIKYFVKKKAPEKKKAVPEGKPQKQTGFLLGCIFLAILTGLLIPTAVINSSPTEFINASTMENPLIYVLSSFLLAAGTFVIWFDVYYKLISDSGKKWMNLGLWLLSGAAVIDYMFFGNNYGILSASLVYDRYPQATAGAKFLNLLILAAVFVLMYFVWKKKKNFVKGGYAVLIAAVAVMSVVNIFNIQSLVHKGFSELEQQAEHEDEHATFHLSKTGKNVVVLMMDRGISGYIPYMLQERPELQEQFDGFTYYPNTISYGSHTFLGAPVFYGGYEYTPVEMNRRDGELLRDKHDEALKVMPVLFRDNDYEVTVCDPSFAGYCHTPNLSIYQDYPEIRCFNTLSEKSDDTSAADVKNSEKLHRDFFCYSLFKISPPILHATLYCDGSYYSSDTSYGQVRDGMAHSVGIDPIFMRSYNVLHNLEKNTVLEDNDHGTFLMMSNNAPHDPAMLQEPQYEPAGVVDNSEYDAAHKDRFVLDGQKLTVGNQFQMINYQGNMASWIQLGNWFDFLREAGVYDNTRIIISADHGLDLGQLENMLLGDEAWEDIMSFNPVLLVKDFDSHGFKTDDRFMTHADVPTLATQGIIGNPTNPFTGKPIDSAQKKEEQHYIFYSNAGLFENEARYTFVPGHWMVLNGDDLFDMTKWSHAEDPLKK